MKSNYMCTVCKKVFPAGEGSRGATCPVTTHITRKHPNCKPVTDYYKLTDKSVDAEYMARYEANRRQYEKFKSKKTSMANSAGSDKKVKRKYTRKTLSSQQVAAQASTGYIDLPVTIRVYLSAIGSVG